MHACDIVAEALEIEDSREQTTYVEKLCGDDSKLLQRVRAMLKFHDRNLEFLGDATFNHALFGERIGEAVGSVIDNYKLLEEIGEGGFGTVYLAEQTKPVKRKVALKLIKLGMDTRQVVARFAAEQQSLAMMDHPNIAQVLDAGSTESGRPYFVMELVNGISITKFCDQNHFTIRQRLELLVKVCHAIQHAHQKGIIHRDLKPSNILVSLSGDKPIPKVIDFGVAKAIDQRLTEHTFFTHFGQMIGTPQYMSPEQAQMSVHDVDIRSDIYTLGVVLFELLTGEPPVTANQLRTAGFDEMRRIIVESEAPKPSSRASTLGQRSTRVADCRAMDSKRLGHSFQGDLDWIVMKTLSKDPDRRYSSASAFAEDLDRHLRDEPVLARPPSAIYRWQKFVRRNRSFVLGGATAAASLLVASFAIVASLLQTRAALETAVLAQSEAEITVNLLEDLITRSDPELGENPDYRLRDALDDFSNDLPDLSDSPRVELQVRLILGRAYERLALNDRAAAQLRRAITLQRDLFGNGDIRVAATLSQLSLLLRRDLPLAQQYSEEAVEICRKLNDTSETMVLAHSAKANSLFDRDQLDDADQVLQDALKALRRVGQVVDESRMPLEFVQLRLAQGRPNEALELVQKLIDEKKSQGVPPPDFARNLLVLCYADLGEFKKADQLLLEILKSSPRAVGAYTFAEKWKFTMRGDLLRKQGKYAEAAEWLDTGRVGMNKAVLGWLLPDWAAVQLDVGHYRKVDDYCREIAKSLSDTDEELYTKVIAHAIRELTLEIYDHENVKKTAIGNRPDFEMAKDRWPNDYGVHYLHAWNLLRAVPGDAAAQEAMVAAKIAVNGIRQASRKMKESFRGTFPIHVLARANAAAGDHEEAIALQRQALGIVPRGHFWLRGYYESQLVEWCIAGERYYDPRQILSEAISDLKQAELPPELQFQLARAELELAEYLLNHGTGDDVAEAEGLIETAKAVLQQSATGSPSEFYGSRAQELLEKCQAKHPATRR